MLPTSVTLNWAPPDDNGSAISDYDIRYRADGAGAFRISGAGVLSFRSAPDFERAGDVGADNVYDVTVEATSGAGDRELTGTHAVAVTVTNVDLPGAPTFDDAQKTRTGLRAEWAAPGSDGGAAIEQYHVRHREQGTVGDASWTTEYPRSGRTAYFIARLSPGKTYEVQARARNSEGPGETAR